MMESTSLLVTGGTGFIGRHLVAHAVARGHRVTVLARDPSRAAFPDGVVSVVPGEITDPGAVRTAARGAQVVVHLAGATRATDPETIHRVNVEATRTIIAACRTEGVRRIVALSSLSVTHAIVGPYAASKRDMEHLLQDSALETVILRPGLVYGPDDRGLFHRLTRVIETLPILPIIGSGVHPVYPIHVEELVEAILFCVSAPDISGRTFDLAGPESLPLREFMRRVSRTLGHPRPQVRIPARAALLAARGLQRLWRDAPISVDNVTGADQTTPVDIGRANGELPRRPISLQEGLPTIRDPLPVPGEDPRRPLRLAIVGLGKMGLTHAALFSMLPSARVAALVDVDPRFGALARALGFRAPFFTSLVDALEVVRPDGVVIATPTHRHTEPAKMAATAGAGVLIEKPLAESLASAEEISRTLMRAGVSGACGYTLGYLPSFERAKALLDAGVLGPVREFESSMYISEVFGPRSGWRYDPSRAGGGVVPNVASHLLFLLHWFFGPATTVEARVRRIHSAVDDEARMRIAFASGIAGAVVTSWSIAGYPLSRTAIVVHGDNGQLRAMDDEVVVHLHHPVPGLERGESRLRPPDLNGDAWFDLGGEAYCRQDWAFVQSLHRGSPMRASLDRALHVQAVIDAVYRSAAHDGAPVAVPTASQDASG